MKTTDLPVPQILKEVAEVVKAVNTEFQDRTSETTVEQIVDARDVPFPPSQEEIYEVIKLPPSERILESTVPVPQALEEVVEVVKALKNDVPTPQILEEIVEAFSAPHERVQQRTVEHRFVEQTVDVPTPHPGRDRRGESGPT